MFGLLSAQCQIVAQTPVRGSATRQANFSTYSPVNLSIIIFGNPVFASCGFCSS